MNDLHEKIKEILKKHDLYNIPVDVVELAKKEDFKILQQDLEDCSGAILVDIKQKFKIDQKEYNKVILINNYQGNARKNFTIAHELGHYFLEFDKENGKIFAHRDDGMIHDQRERKANEFASELLMPYDLLDAFVKEINKNYNNYNIITRAIADAFNVSLSAAMFRFDKYLRGI